MRAFGDHGVLFDILLNWWGIDDRVFAEPNLPGPDPAEGLGGADN